MFLATLALSVAQIASAINYSSRDLVLVFRKAGASSSVHVNNVEFDLGPVSNFMGYAPGSVHAVSYNLSLVQSSFGGSLANVKFAVVGSTTSTANPLQAWVSDGVLSGPAAMMTRGDLATLRGLVESVGVDATYGTSSNASPYVVDSQNGYAFDSVVTGGQPLVLPPDTMGGNSLYPPGYPYNRVPVTAINPTTIAFYQIGIGSISSPATLLGAFTLDVQGNLTYTAGQLPVLPKSNITRITADPVVLGQSTVSFTTALGVNYSFLSASSVTGPWAQVAGSGTANGDGTVQMFTDAQATDPARFYRILSQY